MGLDVGCGHVHDLDGTGLGESWYVMLTQFDQLNCVALPGFARRTDAEIAVRVMPQTGIDWDETSADELRRQYKKFGGRKAIMKFVCEHLQW